MRHRNEPALLAALANLKDCLDAQGAILARLQAQQLPPAPPSPPRPQHRRYLSTGFSMSPDGETEAQIEEVPVADEPALVRGQPASGGFMDVFGRIDGA